MKVQAPLIAMIVALALSTPLTFPLTIEMILDPRLLTLLLSTVLYGWLSLRRKVKVTPEPEIIRNLGRFIGEPRFDPTVGIVANVMVDGKIHEVLVSPKWWQYLPGSKLDQTREECVVTGSPVTLLEKGKEPGSLVCIQNEGGTVVGMGSRIKLGDKTYLLTNCHVLKELRNLFLCKNQSRVELDRGWGVNSWCKNSEMDFITIEVPDKVWSILAVSSASLIQVSGAFPVTCYGAESSSKFLSSSGLATMTKGFTIRHGCTTTNGWSGSPLYYKGSVAGLHRGWEEIGVSNNATNILPLLNKVESKYDNGHIKEISEEELDSRDMDAFDSYVIGGRGTILAGESEFARLAVSVANSKRWAEQNKGRLWADIVDEDEDDFDYRQETVNAGHLNDQQAVSKCSLPSVALVNTLLVSPESSPVSECPSSTLDDRVCVLEKLLETLILSSSKLHDLVSQNSQIMVGQNVVQLRNLIPSCSKPADSEKLKHPETLVKVVKDLSSVTPKPNQGESSQPTTGTKKKSRRRSKRSRPNKSTGIPPLVSQ